MALRYGVGTKRLHLPRRAVPYQDKNDPTRKIAAHGIADVVTAIARAFKNFRATLPIKDMAGKIAGRDFLGAADLVNIATLQHDLRGAFNELAAVYKASGDNAAGVVNSLIPRAVAKDATTFSGQDETPGRYSFDLYAEKVVEALREQQDALITSMTDDVRQTVLDAILQGVRSGMEPASVAGSIRDVIGLNDRQATAVTNYRQALESNSAKALGYALRDKASDATVQAAVDGGNALSQNAIETMVDAYVERALDYRAETIALTETNRAANLGLQDSYAQAIENGIFPSTAVKQYWMLALDEKTCLTCILYAVASNVGIPIGSMFKSDGGEVKGPPVHPRCRCTIEIRTNLDMLP